MTIVPTQMRKAAVDDRDDLLYDLDARHRTPVPFDDRQDRRLGVLHGGPNLLLRWPLSRLPTSRKTSRQRTADAGEVRDRTTIVGRILRHPSQLIPEARVKTVADRLRAARHYADLTQDELADHLGVSPRTIKRWERDDTTPSRAVLIAAAAVCNVPVFFLEHGFAEPRPEPEALPPLPDLPPDPPTRPPSRVARGRLTVPPVTR